jgi:hypothetical protein
MNFVEQNLLGLAHPNLRLSEQLTGDPMAVVQFPLLFLPNI